MNFGGEEFDGSNLRFDDTNPAKEEQEYIDAIEADVKWLGYSWNGEQRYASDYFEQLYVWAELLISEGKAYVDDLTADEMREYQGTLTKPVGTHRTAIEPWRRIWTLPAHAVG